MDQITFSEHLSKESRDIDFFPCQFDEKCHELGKNKHRLSKMLNILRKDPIPGEECRLQGRKLFTEVTILPKDYAFYIVRGHEDNQKIQNEVDTTKSQKWLAEKPMSSVRVWAIGSGTETIDSQLLQDMLEWKNISESIHECD